MLEDVGFTKEQAETSIEILLEIMENKLATKDDIIHLKEALKLFKSELKMELTLRMGAMLVATIASILKFL